MRKTVLLEGEWEVTETKDTIQPTEFHRTVQVPGLLDMAKPGFDSIGYILNTPTSRNYREKGIKCGKRNYFWYRKILKEGFQPSDFAYLKIHKAYFGVAVYVNGNYAGKEFLCYTPSYFEISKFLKANSDNEILIRVGATPEELPQNIPWGRDFEKAIYYPGLWDRVELFTANYPYIKNIQTVPNIYTKQLRVVVNIENGKTPKNFALAYEIQEKATKKVILNGTTSNIKSEGNEKTDFDFTVSLPDCQLWSPENPFLYELTLKSPGDSKQVTFGMREFKIDSVSKKAMLNGKPYYLRGTNVAIQRFFEDTARHGLPWDRKWIEKMHNEFKDMHWNSYRFHVGFAPEVWYEIADEKGFLIADEYALWGFDMDLPNGGIIDTAQYPKPVLVKEFTHWMQERWNHPSLAIWDACNETVYKVTGEVISEVRHLDLSNRPWENAYNEPLTVTDIKESHPYLLELAETNEDLVWVGDQTDRPKGGVLKREFSYNPIPLTIPLHPKIYAPILVNEYGWIWLYRDGGTGTIAKAIWNAFPEMDTPEKRWEMRGRFIAAMTEWWRSRREVIGVQHFCALTCDRPWGKRPSQVSDEWKDLRNLIMQPRFKKYVKPAFAPVGIMIRKWDNAYAASEKVDVPVALINDLTDGWSGDVTLKILKDGKVVSSETQSGRVNAADRSELLFQVTMPATKAEYEMIAEIQNKEVVFSSRMFVID